MSLQLSGILVEGIETSLHGSGQLDYEVAPSNDDNHNSSSANQITPTAEAMQAGSSRQPPIYASPQNVSPAGNQVSGGVVSQEVGGVSGGTVSQVVGVVSQEVGVVSKAVEKLKKDMTAVWSMSSDVRSLSATAPPTINPHIPTTSTPSQPPESHSQTGGMECEPDSNKQDPEPSSSADHHTLTPSHPPSPPHDKSPPVATTATNPVAMETEKTPDPQTNQQSTSDSAAVPMTTEQISTSWFSLTPRSPCETKPAVTVATAALQNGVTEAQYQLVATTAGGQQLLAQPTPSGMMQYYITPSSAVAAAPTQQLQVGYALVGNTLVPQQYLAAATPQQQFLVSQGGVQYLVGGGASGLLGVGGMAVLPQTGGVAIGEGGALVHTLGERGGAVVLGGAGGVVTEDEAANTTALSVGGVRAEAVTNHVAAPTDPPCDVTPSQTQDAVAMETRESVETKPVSPVVSKGQVYIST